MMDPIFTPIFLGMGLSSTMAGIASSLVGFVLAAGVALLGMLLAPQPPEPDDVKTTVQQPVPPRNFGYGTARTGGYTMLAASTGSGIFYHVVAIASHEIDRYEFFYFN